MPRNKFGQKWQHSDTDGTEIPTRQRMQWKTNIVESSAVIAALDFVTSLVSRYAFAGDTNDYFGTKHLTVGTSPTFGVATPIYGQYAIFNGSSQHRQSPNNTDHDQTTNSFAITDWIILDSLASENMIAAKRDPGVATNKGYRVYVNTAGKLVAEFCDGSASVVIATGNTVMATGKPYFIAVIFDRTGSMTLYVWDPVGAASISPDASAVISAQSASISNTQTFTVGRRSDSAASFYAGKMDQLQIFNGLITVANLTQIYSDLHSGQIAISEDTGNGLVRNTIYMRDIENTKWRFLGVWPDADGLANQVMKTDGAGVLAWNYTHMRRMWFFFDSKDDYDVVGANVVENRPGVQLITNGSIGDFVYARSLRLNMPGNKRFEMLWQVADQVVQTQAEMETGIYNGSSEVAPQTTNSGATFELDYSADTTIYARNANGTTETRTDLNEAFAVAVYEILFDGTNLKFYKDGVLKATHTTNLPAGGTNHEILHYTENEDTPDSELHIGHCQLVRDV